MVTVLMAVYNGEKYLREQMDSILRQAVKKDHIDLKIIASDDGSKDGSRELLKEYETKFPKRVKVILREQPSGSAENHFLSLLSEADDDYIMLSDQDDVWLRGKTSCLLRKMREMERIYGRECPILVHSDMAVVDEKLDVISESYFKYQKISPERTKLSHLLVQNNVTGGAVMINRAMLPYLRKKPKICLMHDSWLALIAACFGQIGCVKKPLYLYRQHGDNSLGAKKADTAEEAAKRLVDGSAARENYRRMFGQAECLLTMYGKKLKAEDRETLKAFLNMRKKGRIGKIRTMIRYDFTKNSLKRTVGQMLFLNADT